MECPKCGYLGFDDAPRCRNCSYDFALAATPAELALEELDCAADAGPDPRRVFDVSDLDALLQKAEAIGVTPPEAGAPAAAVLPPPGGLETRDLDALTTSQPRIAADQAMDALTWPTAPASLREPSHAWDVALPVEPPPAQSRPGRPPLEMSALDDLDIAPAAFTRPPTAVRTDAPVPGRGDTVDTAAIDRLMRERAQPEAQETRATHPAGRGMAIDDDAPLVKLQQPRAPVAVRKTPMSPKLRAVARPAAPPEPAFDFLDAPEAVPVAERTPAFAGTHETGAELESSPPLRRLAAAAIDGALFVGIDLAVLYLTFRIVGLSAAEWRILPLWPLVIFLFGMKVSYASVFTAMGGQTIGKMATGIRVVSMDDRAVNAATAVRRTLASCMAVATAGLGYLPGLIGHERRALHDRVSGTRVVMAPAA